MVEFTGLAAEAQPTRTKTGNEYKAGKSFWRSPYMAYFKAGGFDFIIMAQHARWGNVAGRLGELKNFGLWIGTRWGKEGKFVFDDDLIVVGDFNISKIGDEFYKALTEDSDLQMPDALTSISDTAFSPGDKCYDQILYRSGKKFKMKFTNNGGVIDFAKDDLLKKLFPTTNEKKLTWELSDHFPLWAQINIDNESQRLDNFMVRE